MRKRTTNSMNCDPIETIELEQNRTLASWNNLLRKRDKYVIIHWIRRSKISVTLDPLMEVERYLAISLAKKNILYILSTHCLKFRKLCELQWTEDRSRSLIAGAFPLQIRSRAFKRITSLGQGVSWKEILIQPQERKDKDSFKSQHAGWIKTVKVQLALKTNKKKYLSILITALVRGPGN